MVPSRAVAEEAVQDTWLGVVRGIERFEGASSFKTWLFRILVNRARSAGAKERRTESLCDDDQPLGGRFERSGAWAEAAEDRGPRSSWPRRCGTAWPGCRLASGRWCYSTTWRPCQRSRCARCWGSPTGIVGCCYTGGGPGCAQMLEAEMVGS